MIWLQCLELDRTSLKYRVQKLILIITLCICPVNIILSPSRKRRKALSFMEIHERMKANQTVLIAWKLGM